MQFSQRLARPLLLAAAALAVSAPAHALFGDDDARRAILELRERMDAAQNAQVMLQGQIDQLREQNSKFIGQIDELGNAVQQQRRAAKELFGDLDKRLRVIEPTEETIDGKAQKVSSEETRRYKTALALFMQEKYTACLNLLELLLVDTPETPYAASALYWRGTALYAAGRMKEAVTMQDELIERFPKHERVPEAKLSKAAALTGLGNKTAAVKLLKEIIKDYEGTGAAEQAVKRLKSLSSKSAKK